MRTICPSPANWLSQIHSGIMYISVLHTPQWYLLSCSPQWYIHIRLIVPIIGVVTVVITASLSSLSAALPETKCFIGLYLQPTGDYRVYYFIFKELTVQSADSPTFLCGRPPGRDSNPGWGAIYCTVARLRDTDTLHLTGLVVIFSALAL